MRLFAILLLLLIAGLGFALWQGIDLGTGRLAGAPEKMGVEEVELTAADPGAIEAAPEEAPAVADAPAEVAEAPANDAEAPAETAEAPATEVPVEIAAAPEPETPMPAEMA